MLQTLKIANLALVDKAELTFDKKLNVISGETGAGKSIMLDALSFVFGGRADRSLIRSGENSMKVEAIFVDLSEIHKNFIKNELNISCDDEMFISRELDLSGKNTCKINGELVPVASVKKICSLSVDIHGQSEHLAILDNDYQLHIVDLFSKTADVELKQLAELIEKIKEIDKEINELGGSEREKQNLIDLYSFQVQEIKNANVGENEYETLLNEKKEMQQFEKINESLRLFCEGLSGSSFDGSALAKANEALKNIQNICSVNGHYQELYDRLKSAILEVEDIEQTAKIDLANNVFDEAKFNEIDNRVDFIKSLFRKYGGDYQNMAVYYEETNKKLNNLINGEKRYNELKEEKEILLTKVDAVQDRLSKIRKSSAKDLVAKMQQELQTLGMPNARMDVEFTRIEERYSQTGFDRVEFMFSSNLGFEVKPLSKVVSGGEMSRVMLAYKIVVSAVDNIQTIIFDEIDSGLSGKIAFVVAEYMARLSVNKQIIAVSHLPQICAMADYNLKVEKYSDNVTTHTKATHLVGDELLAEITRLMGADYFAGGKALSGDLKQKSESYKQQINLH